tara:strand:- start:9 stop:194 length:186 start_codon:yes stop_codon:yes gene_type:complete
MIAFYEENFVYIYIIDGQKQNSKRSTENVKKCKKNWHKVHEINNYFICSFTFDDGEPLYIY